MSEIEVQEFIDRLDYAWAKDYVSQLYEAHTMINELYAREISYSGWMNHFEVTEERILFKANLYLFEFHRQQNHAWEYKVVRDKMGKNTLTPFVPTIQPLIDTLDIGLYRNGERSHAHILSQIPDKQMFDLMIKNYGSVRADWSFEENKTDEFWEHHWRMNMNALKYVDKTDNTKVTFFDYIITMSNTTYPYDRFFWVRDGEEGIITARKKGTKDEVTIKVSGGFYLIYIPQFDMSNLRLLKEELRKEKERKAI
ncbi:MAG: hypothetical protein QXL94_06450 [Candidatus Parvarchaeum sp.]